MPITDHPVRFTNANGTELFRIQGNVIVVNAQTYGVEGFTEFVRMAVEAEYFAKYGEMPNTGERT